MASRKASQSRHVSLTPRLASIRRPSTIANAASKIAFSTAPPLTPALVSLKYRFEYSNPAALSVLELTAFEQCPRLQRVHAEVQSGPRTYRRDARRPPEPAGRMQFGHRLAVVPEPASTEMPLRDVIEKKSRHHHHRRPAGHAAAGPTAFRDFTWFELVPPDWKPQEHTDRMRDEARQADRRLQARCTSPTATAP
jgi:hypothetical protein